MRSLVLLGCVAALALSPASLAAQQDARPAASGDRDPDAMAALDRMGTALRRLNSFGMRADVTTEQVLTTGQKLQNSGSIDFRVRRPNGFRIEIDSDREARTIYYDGRSVTVVAPRVGYYASFPARPTIRETLAAARDRFDLELPLSELFNWDSSSEVAGRLTSAFRVGDETIGGQVCEQYAMRQAGVDWQIWIRRGANALPCKLVITTTDDPSMPQYTALFTWRPQETFAASTFAFTPPANARQITFAEMTPTAQPGSQ